MDSGKRYRGRCDVAPTRVGTRLTERVSFADPKLATEERVDHALAIARRPDANAVTPARGLTHGEISAHLREVYGAEVSKSG
jgi:hypothetical protein